MSGGRVSQNIVEVAVDDGGDAEVRSAAMVLEPVPTRQPYRVARPLRAPLYTPKPACRLEASLHPNSWPPKMHSSGAQPGPGPSLTLNRNPGLSSSEPPPKSPPKHATRPSLLTNALRADGWGPDTAPTRRLWESASVALCLLPPPPPTHTHTHTPERLSGVQLTNPTFFITRCSRTT